MTKRVPLQVSPLFRERLHELQKKILIKKGKLKSLTKITEELSQIEIFINIEKNLLKEPKVPEMNIKIKMDKRFL